jgi:hypothetical protein
LGACCRRRFHRRGSRKQAGAIAICLGVFSVCVRASSLSKLTGYDPLQVQLLLLHYRGAGRNSCFSVCNLGLRLRALSYLSKLTGSGPIQVKLPLLHYINPPSFHQWPLRHGNLGSNKTRKKTVFGDLQLPRVWASAAVCREAVAADSGAWALAAAVDFAAEVISRKRAEETARCVHLGLRLREPYHCYANDLFTPIPSFLSQSQRRFGAVTIKKIIKKIYYYYLSKLTGYDPYKFSCSCCTTRVTFFRTQLPHPSPPQSQRRYGAVTLKYYIIIISSQEQAGATGLSLCEFGLAS